jgi:hypothetical protein
MNGLMVIKKQNKLWADFLRKEIDFLCNRIDNKKAGQGHLYTTIKVLENRVKELEKE